MLYVRDGLYWNINTICPLLNNIHPVYDLMMGGEQAMLYVDVSLCCLQQNTKYSMLLSLLLTYSHSFNLATRHQML